jgi:hypothetical protein
MSSNNKTNKSQPVGIELGIPAEYKEETDQADQIFRKEFGIPLEDEPPKEESPAA